MFEDGQQLDAGQVELTLLDRNVAATHHTVLLVDTSALSAADAGAMARGIELFSEKVSKSQAVSIYAFDGSAQLRPLAKVSRGGSTEPPRTEDSDAGAELATEPSAAGAAPERISAREPQRRALGPVTRPERRAGTRARGARNCALGGRAAGACGDAGGLQRGADLAGRVSVEQLDAALDRTHAALVAISVGSGRGLRLDRIGRDGVVSVPTLIRVERAFEQAADRVAALEHSHYLIAYCSPSRAGERKLRVEVRTPGKNGEPLTGAFETAFDARGFGSGCDPKAPPQFVVTLAPGVDGPIPAALPAGVDAGSSGAEVVAKPAAAPTAPPAASPKRRRPAKPPPPPEQPPSDFEP